MSKQDQAEADKPRLPEGMTHSVGGGVKDWFYLFVFIIIYFQKKGI